MIPHALLEKKRSFTRSLLVVIKFSKTLVPNYDLV